MNLVKNALLKNVTDISSNSQLSDIDKIELFSELSDEIESHLSENPILTNIKYAILTIVTVSVFIIMAIPREGI